MRHVEVAHLLTFLTEAFVLARLLRFGSVRGIGHMGLTRGLHLGCGVIVTATSPYFAIRLAAQTMPHGWLLLSSGLLTLVVAITGIRLISHLPKEDILMRRAMANQSLGFIGTSLLTIALIPGLLSPGYRADLTVVGALIALVGLLTILLTVAEFASNFRKLPAATMHEAPTGEVRSSLHKELLSVVSPHRAGTSLYQGNNWTTLVSTLPLLLAGSVMGMVQGAALIHHGSNVYEQCGEFVPILLTILCWLAGVQTWGVFEITLVLRGRSSLRTGQVAAFMTVVLPFVVAVLYGMAWSGKGIVDLLMASALLC